MSSDSPRTPFLVLLYQQYLSTQDSGAFIEKSKQVYSQGTLQRLVDHSLPEVRRGAVLALGFLGDYEANHTVGCALHDEDRTVRTLAENSIRTIWTRVGDDEDRQLLGIIIRLNSAQQYEEAECRATDLIDRMPGFAEAWNQRAIARFALKKFAASIRDAHQSLEINPYHFSAATGMAQAYLQLGNHVSALECFRRALRLNPDLEGARSQVARLTRLIDDK